MSTILLEIYFITDTALRLFRVFPNSWKIFGQVLVYRAFRLCGFIAVHAFIFIFLKMHWVRSLDMTKNEFPLWNVALWIATYFIIKQRVLLSIM